MSEPARHLHSVDPQTGQLFENCPRCAELQDEIDGLKHEKASWRVKFQNLKRDKEKDARADALWPKALELFNYWREECRHPNSAFTADRFWLLEPYLREHGLDICKRAVDGAAYDPFITRRKNGSSKRHDDLDLIFRSASKMEEFANRAPRPTEEERCSSDEESPGLNDPLPTTPSESRETS